MAYKHGPYGELTDSKVQSVSQADVVAAYVGTAPVNLIRGYADADIINFPIKLTNMSDAQTKTGYATDWGAFSLCEVMAEHFDNTVKNCGPIYIVNVLDPDVHRADEQTTKALTFKNKRAEFESSDIILDTFAIADMAEGVDYTLSYNFAKGAVVVKLLGDAAEAPAQCSYYTVDASMVEAADIIGQKSEDGIYSGLFALCLLYQYHNAVLNLLAVPGWSQIPAVYQAMVSIVQKLNGHWDAFASADIPLVDDEGKEINTRAKAIKWAEEHGYTSEFCKPCWPKVKDGNGRVFHLSTVATATMLRVDQSNDGIPFESPSNKEIMATAQFFGENSKNRGFDQSEANELNEKGITTACFWGGRWVLWGPHTGAYSDGGSMDARAIFDSSIRMLLYITNGFQMDHGTEIDSPMTPQDKDTILNAEKERLDNLKGRGALIGEPIVEFVESSNPVGSMMNGDFVWDFSVTPTPPKKSMTARVCYTDEGFAAFFETE